MIECVFTIDYEIYGDGHGSLKEHIYDPAQKLACMFHKWNSRLVVFVEVAELEIIGAAGTDPAIALVEEQLQQFYHGGFEVGLHLHPQWYRGRYETGGWILDYREYNLSTLPRERIIQIVDRAIDYLRRVLGNAEFTPLSFRAGNFLFQPTATVAEVLAARGIKIDSSVFKGGQQHQHKLDYRRALKNGYHWWFKEDVEVPDPLGDMLELPAYTQMVPNWNMFTTKRIALQRRNFAAKKTGKEKLYRLLDLLRLFYPLKLDFCRMTFHEMVRLMERVIREDKEDPMSFKPIVLIGHTKDLVDFTAVESFLAYLRDRGIAISTFEEVFRRCEKLRNTVPLS